MVDDAAGLPVAARGAMMGPFNEAVMDVVHPGDQRSPPARIRPPALPGQRILIVEDSADVQVLLREYLAPTRAEVLQVYDGQAGVTQVLAAAAEGRPIALVLMDQQLPGLDGYTATRQLRRMGHTMPIVAITAAGVESNRLLAERSGCSAWLPKPLLPEDLYRVIAELLFEERSAQASPTGPIRPASSAPLADLEDYASQAELLRGYLQRLAERRGQIARVHTEGATTDLRRIAHQIRGSASSYGFPALGQAAARLEEAIDQAQPAQVTEGRVSELLAMADRVLAGA